MYSCLLFTQDSSLQTLTFLMPTPPAPQDKGSLSLPELCSKAGWNQTRAQDCLDGLLKEGLAMIDDGAPDGVRLFWFPAVGVALGGGGSGGAATARAAAAAAGAPG